jgi:hypothetical protein
MFDVMDEIDAPILIDDGPADDRRVIAVPIDDAFERLLFAHTGAFRRYAHVGQLGPDQHADPVGDLVISRVGRFDMTANAVEPELPRLQELVFQEFD